MVASDGNGLQAKPVGLWPLPDQMAAYLNSWERYAGELEQQVARLEATHKAETATLHDELARAQHQLITIEKPLREKTMQLESQLTQEKYTVEKLREEIAAATTRLAQGLEITTASRGLVLLTLINDALILLEEAKRQFRESL